MPIILNEIKWKSQVSSINNPWDMKVTVRRNTKNTYVLENESKVKIYTKYNVNVMKVAAVIQLRRIYSLDLRFNVYNKNIYKIYKSCENLQLWYSFVTLHSWITVANFHNVYKMFCIYFHFIVVFSIVYISAAYTYCFLHKMSYFCLHKLFQPFDP